MPVYAPDYHLLSDIRRYVEERQGGVIMRAAAELKLDYHMLRRFLGSARAKPENRERIRNALQQIGWELTKEHEDAQRISVDVTRSMLTQLLEALDVYQGVAAGAAGVRG